MDWIEILKAGFVGFAQSLGIIMLVFYICGTFLNVTRQRFFRTFLLAGIASFLVVDVFLYFNINQDGGVQTPLELSSTIGGWLAGIFFGMTRLRPYLLGFLK